MTIIATWKMALNGTKLAREALLRGAPLEEALITLIKDVEMNEDFHSVGYSGLPNEDGVVECDAAIMNGDNLHFGAVAGLRNIRSAGSKKGQRSQRYIRATIQSAASLQRKEELSQLHRPRAYL